MVSDVMVRLFGPAHLANPPTSVCTPNGRSAYIRRWAWASGCKSGRRAIAYLAVPESGAGAGVLVLQAWWGLTSVFTDVCDRLAAEGYVALAPSLYADGATTAAIAEAEAVVQAAVDQLRGLLAMTGAQIGVIGSSLGAASVADAAGRRPRDRGGLRDERR